MASYVSQRLTTLFFVVASALAPASSGGVETPHKDWFQYLAGTWEVKRERHYDGRWEVFGKKSEVRRILAAGGHAVIGDRGVSGGVTVFGWRPDVKALIRIEYDVNGGCIRDRFPVVTKNEMEGEGSEHRRKPETPSAYRRLVLRIIDDNTFEEYRDSLFVIIRSSVKEIWTRKTEQTVLPSFTDATTSNNVENQSDLKWIRYLAGEWHTTAWDGREWTSNYVAIANGHALVSDPETAREGPVVVLGWQFGALVSTQFNTDGTFIEHRFAEITDDELRGTRIECLFEGKCLKGTSTLRRVSEDTWEEHFEMGLPEGERAGVNKSTRVKKER